MGIKKITLLIFFFISSVFYAQQIGDGRATEISDFSVPLRSGAYQGYWGSGMNPDLSFGWQHLLVVRHSSDLNNHQLQLSSSYTENDRLFFRKIAGSLAPNNPSWIELATRGSNTYSGSQNIMGSQNLTGNLTIGQEAEISTIAGPASSGAIQIKTNGYAGGSTNRFLRLGWKDNNAIFSPALSINEDLNVGIGTINPDSKLAVNGTIHSKEVKVDMTGWSDFVFKKEYVLPTLEEVEKHIAEKGHLENVPSEKEVLDNGINLGEISSKFLQKIEELTLYLLQQEKKNNDQYVEIENLKQEIEILKKERVSFENIIKRLSVIEQKLK